MGSDAAQRARDTENIGPQHDVYARHEFDLVQAPERVRVQARQANSSDIPMVLRAAEAAIGAPLADETVVRDLVRAHPDTVWVFWRNGLIVGGVALLMLNATGIARLIANRIDLKRPPVDLLAPPGHPPAAIYVWALLGRLTHAEGVSRVIVRLQQPPYRQSDMFALPATADGLRFLHRLGFRLVPNDQRSLYRYVRLANRTQSAERAIA